MKIRWFFFENNKKKYRDVKAKKEEGKKNL